MLKYAYLVQSSIVDMLLKEEIKNLLPVNKQEKKQAVLMCAIILWGTNKTEIMS